MVERQNINRCEDTWDVSWLVPSEKADQAIVVIIDKIYMCKIPWGPWCVCENLKVVLDLKMSESCRKMKYLQILSHLTLDVLASWLIPSRRWPRKSRTLQHVKEGLILSQRHCHQIVVKIYNKIKNPTSRIINSKLESSSWNLNNLAIKSMCIYLLIALNNIGCSL